MQRIVDISSFERSVLCTERLTIRPFLAEDLDDFHAYAKVDGVGQPGGWLPHRDLDESRQILDRFLERRRALALVEGGRVIGSIALKEIPDGFTEFADLSGCELGFTLAKDRWGQGLMTEAVQAVIRRLFDEEKIDVLLCGRFDSNRRSARVQEKCGFVPYRRLMMTNAYGEEEPGQLNLLLRDPKIADALAFSHPETLIYEGSVVSPEEMIALYRAQTGVSLPCECWAFGDSPDKLAGLVHRGIKRATCSAYPLYAADGEPIPKEGDLSVIENSQGYAVALIRTDRVTVCRFSEVGEEFAEAEGEGDRSLAYWRKVHREFFTRELAGRGMTFDEDLTLVCEEFSVLFRAEDCRAAKKSRKTGEK